MSVEGWEHLFAGGRSGHSEPLLPERQVTNALLPYFTHQATGS